MSAAATHAPARAFTNARRVARFPLAVPADVTVLRSGMPYSIPGRSVTLGERGVGLILAGELHPGDSVGIEFRLPDAGGAFLLKAIVRHQALLQCGLEFVSLTSKQQKLIEDWTRRQPLAQPTASPPAAGGQSSALPPGASSTSRMVVPGEVSKRKSGTATLRRVTWLAFVGILLLTVLGWWHWHQAWSELESQIPAVMPRSQPPVYVPAEVMEGILVHQIEPIYPEAARQAKVQGIVILDAIIGTDGTVVDLHPISGPDELTPAALDAVKWWRFQPYLLNGEAVQVKTRLAVDFREH